jgi:secondary thiamine-phosphate synthase enzyme
MSVYKHRFDLTTRAHDEVIDITDAVRQAVRASGVSDGICTVFTPHATAAVTINENDDPNIGADFMNALQKIVVEHDGWLHDRVDNNAAAHIKSAIVGPSETIPVESGKLALGTWQNVFFCEFDGPRSRRGVVVVVMG